MPVVYVLAVNHGCAPKLLCIKFEAIKKTVTYVPRVEQRRLNKPSGLGITIWHTQRHSVRDGIVVGPSMQLWYTKTCKEFEEVGACRRKRTTQCSGKLSKFKLLRMRHS